MPLEPPDSRHCQAAIGYCELGLLTEANDELDRIDPLNRAAPEVLSIRVAIYHGLKKWDALQTVATRLVEHEPTNVQWVISLAYATRRADSIESAREILLAALPCFPAEAVIPFNLGCYFCQLGELEVAKDHLRRAFEIDATWRAAALDDTDLEPLWTTLRLQLG